jgi:hypothetical protein
MSPMPDDVLNTWVMYPHMTPDEDHLVAATHQGERWALELPHHCDEWPIAEAKTKAEAIDIARRFIAEVEAGIRRMELMDDLEPPAKVNES